jgi:hypothetical protein
MTTPGPAASPDRAWYIIGRWQEFEGESRANLIRIVAIGAFYLVQLQNFYFVYAAHSDQLKFHQQATGVAVAWTMVALGAMLCLRRRIFPAALKYCSTACDLLLLTTIAALANRALSPLVLGYFLIIAMSAMRFSVGLVWFSTLGSMVGYYALVGLTDPTWFDAHHVVKVHTQLITLLSLGLTGIVIGQVVRRAKSLAAEYAQRLQAKDASSPAP